ncbi:DNA circularization N-terminal domain-containing protein [Vibrio scophthalmi]|uniref:DNA circularization N-terminal domain-containing protein n=1 Tax=Vibrio scophthalmi TaxID=45658 RepID=UPI003AAB7ADE
MWERQYEHARWNGHKLNILSTAIDGGQRLHVSEIPYAELPHIKVMGSKARNFNFEMVFVGPSSLADANAFIDILEKSPEGELEHPWLGELSLVYETFSQSISTKRGLVTLSLTFVRAGTSPKLTAPTTIRAKEQANIVEALSAKTFSKDVGNMSVAEINQTQQSFTGALNTLVDITSRLNLADDTLKSIHHAINAAFSAVTSLSNRPEEFASLFSGAVNSVADGVQSEPTFINEAVDNSRSAQTLMLGQVEENATTKHHNVQMVTAAVKMNKDITELEKADTFDVTKANKQPDIIQADLAELVTGVDDRISDVTSVATMESIALFDSLVVLKSNVQKQRDKVIAGCMPHRIVQAPRCKPALAIAHDEYTKENIVTAINAFQHPLFMRGEISVRDDA